MRVLHLLFAAALTISLASAQDPIRERIRKLRSLDDQQRARETKQLALDIRRLPATLNKEALAESLANLVTEGDPGQQTLQEVATTLAQVLNELPLKPDKGQPANAYVTLAQLVRYEHVDASSSDPQFAAAMDALKADDERRQTADFTLADLDGKSWTLKQLRGEVVLVNFWATWCPPCRKEMPDLDALYRQFQNRGLVILAISDEERGKVSAFLAEHKVTYPILLDPGRKVNELFHVEGIPKSFVYNRDGKMVAEAIDMRTKGQFLRMLAQAGLRP